MWWLLACTAALPPLAPDPPSAPDPSATIPTGDSAGNTDSATTDTPPTDTALDPTDTTDGDGLVGVAVDPPLAPPVFRVLDADGVERTEAWLTGHPTVLWFFREAEGTT